MAGTVQQGRMQGPSRTIALDAAADPGAGRIVESLAAAVEAKDPDTGRHLYRSAFLANACLKSIDPAMAGREEVVFGFVLHDVGKIGIPDDILRKTASLTDAEWTIMRTHPEIGLEIVRPLGFDTLTTDVVAYHHERWDGLGYPYGLKGTEIPLAARVFAVADNYDAMTAERSYRPAMTKVQARADILRGSGTHFDPAVVEAFFSLIR